MRLIFLLVFLLGFNYVNAQLFSGEKILNKENLDKKDGLGAISLDLTCTISKLNIKTKVKI